MGRRGGGYKRDRSINSRGTRIARQLGALPFGEACADAELAGRGADASGLPEAVRKMAVEFAATRSWMDSLSVS